MNKVIFNIIFFLAFKLSRKFSYLLRFYFYRSSVLEPENLILLESSQRSYIETSKENIYSENILNHNECIRLGFLGCLSNSLLFNNNFWKVLIDCKSFDFYMYELLAENYTSDVILSNFNHKIFEGYYYKKKLDRVFKDGFDYMKLANLINEDKLDFLMISIETIGRFTYSKLLNNIKTNTKIIAINAGNVFYSHPKIFIQAQIQLPPCWKVENNKLLHSSGKTIDNYIFIKDLFFYDKRDIVVKKNIKEIFENIIFVHGRLSKLYQIDYLEIISTLLINNKDLKFIFMGYDDQNVLSKLYDYFTKNKLIDRIEYSGSYSQAKNKDGIITDENWKKCKFYLENAALYLNPFPKGSGSSRIESFASGLPVIDYEIDFMDCSKRSEKAYILEPLIKKFGTGYTKEEYLNLAQKTLNDIQYRKNIINEQYKIVNDFCDEYVFWNKIENTIKKYHNV